MARDCVGAGCQNRFHSKGVNLGVLHDYRERINKAESTEDVKKSFSYTVKRLLEDVFGRELRLNDGDIVLKLGRSPYYVLSKRILLLGNLADHSKDSDLPHVICRLAGSAIHRNCHLNRHPERTNAKIRM